MPGAIVCSLFLFPLLTSGPAAQDRVNNPTGGRKQARAVRVPNGAIHVDGRVDEEAWHRATPITDFIQKEPNEGIPPTEQMEVRFVHDDGAIYVGARMYKREGAPVQAPMSRRDRGEQAEYILVSLDTFLDRRTAYAFGVTASGVRIDRFNPRDDETTPDEGFDPVWEAKTTVDEHGWTAELWIPFSQLRFNEQTDRVWGLNVQRFTPTLNEDDYWVPVPRTQKGWASRFGDLRGIEGLHSSRRIEILPYLAGASTVTANRDPSNPFDDGRNLKSHGGADFKVGLGPSLTLDAAVNPDFGQVEADPAEVNLSAFETIFTEKRPFFVEGARLLNLGPVDNFFYSRRIGAQPTGLASGDFVDYPRSNTIVAAGKVTGRLASGTSVGILGALTDEEIAKTSNRGFPAIAAVRVAPRTAYGVARVQQEFGPAASTVSAMVTAVHRDVQPGDPLAALLARSAFTASSDSVLRFKGGQYELSSYGGVAYVAGRAAAIERVQRSSARYLQRPDKDYAPFDPTRTSLQGYKAGALFERTGGTHWIWNVKNDYESPGFESNDIGRLRSADGIQIIGDLRYRETQPGRALRNYWIGVNQTNEWNYGGDRQIGSLQLYANQSWKNFWNTQMSVTSNFRTLDERLTRGGPLMEVPRGWTADVQLRNSAAARTGWSGRITVSSIEDGGLMNRFIGHVSVRPGPRWQLSLDPTLLRQVDSQQYVSTQNGGRAETFGKRYIFSSIDRSTYSTQLRLNYTFKPDINLDVYAEPFAASGHYYNLGELAAAGSRQRRYGTSGTSVASQPDGSLLVTEGNSTFKLDNNDFRVQSFRSNIVLRWEWRPGSTLYLVWQQDRRVSEAIGQRIGLRDPFRSLTAPGTNFFVVKTSFWLPVR